MDIKYIAKTLQKQHNWVEAAKAWQNVLDDNPDSQKSLRNIAYCYHMQESHQLEEAAIKKLTSIAKLENESVFAIARHYLLHGHPDIALKYFMKLQGNDYRIIEVFAGIAECQISLGQEVDEGLVSRLVEFSQSEDLSWKERYKLWQVFLKLHRYRNAIKSVGSMLLKARTVRQFILAILMVCSSPFLAFSFTTKTNRSLIALLIVLALFVLPLFWKIVFAVLIMMPIVSIIMLMFWDKRWREWHYIVILSAVVLFILAIIVISL